MKRIRYTKFTGDLASSFGLEDLMQALSDFLLDSGFQDPYSQFQEFNGDQTMENLREAIRQALESGDLFDEEAQEKFDALPPDQVEELIDQIIQKMQEQNFINAELPEQGQGQQDDFRMTHEIFSSRRWKWGNFDKEHRPRSARGRCLRAEG